MALNARQLAGRFLVPGFVVTLISYFRYKSKISPKAEVEISGNLQMGPGGIVSSFTKFKTSDGPLIFGDRCGVATNCFIASAPGGIEIGDNFVCGPNVVISASNYKHDEIGVHYEDQGVTSKGIKIGHNVWIGAGSVILDGSVLGDNCIVVANSLVNRRYPDNSIIQGSPAKIIMKRER